MLRKPGRTVKRARSLRTDMSLPEVLLWQVLRARPDGIKFRRQHPAGPYILDFYCAAAKLAVEVDGEAHGRGDRPERDGRRDEMLASHGVTTLRVRAADVLGDLNAVVRHVVHAAHARLPLHHSAAPSGPPPRAGLGED